MKEFNHRLNMDGREERFERWQDYRKAITSFIIEHCHNSSISNMIILGAGNCHDLDLAALSRLDCSITLSDIDDEALMYGLEIQGKSDKDFSLIHSDYLCGCIDPLHTYDVVVCLPIYTQLYFPMQYEAMLMAYENGKIEAEELVARQRELLDGMPAIIDSFNENVMDLMTNTSQLIVFSDLIEDEPSGHYIEAYKTETSYDAVINDYVEIYGMGLGNYGLYHLEQHLKMLAHKWFLWQFDEKRSMVVKGVVFER